MESYQQDSKNPIMQKKKRKWLVPFLIVVAIIVGIAGFFAWKAGFTLSKISTEGGSGLLQSLTRVIPGVESKVKGENEGRINIALLGMRGENVPGGGTLADTIMVLSVEPQANRAALVSIPRDLWVKNPGSETYSKINAVHAYGEENGKQQGLSQMEKVLEDVLGLPIHYAVKIDFKGFKELIDVIGGVQITLDNPFEEGVQFNEPKVCDPYVFTKPAIDPVTKKQMVETKYFTRKNGTRDISAQYPMCTNPDTECGGDFKLPAGTQTLNGEQALCFARSRATSSDFERAKRQQIIVQKIQEKIISLGTMSDFGKVNAMLETLGNNVKTDLQAWEMKRLYDLYKNMQNIQVTRRVLEASEEGLLYFPPTTPEKGSILSPIGDNYDKIREMFRNIFALPEQSDINPK